MVIEALAARAGCCAAPASGDFCISRALTSSDLETLLGLYSIFEDPGRAYADLCMMSVVLRYLISGACTLA